MAAQHTGAEARRRHLETAGIAFAVSVDGAGLWLVAHVAGAASGPVCVATTAACPVALAEHACPPQDSVPTSLKDMTQSVV